MYTDEDEVIGHKTVIKFEYHIVSKNYDQIQLQPVTPNKETFDEQKLIAGLKEGTHRQIIDFDNHFEDISLDFNNEFVV